jgi:hypothetical protein
MPLAAPLRDGPLVAERHGKGQASLLLPFIPATIAQQPDLTSFHPMLKSTMEALIILRDIVESAESSASVPDLTDRTW